MLEAVAAAARAACGRRAPRGDVRRRPSRRSRGAALARRRGRRSRASRSRLMQPVLPMLAQPAEDIAGRARARSAPPLLEWKLDGARVQVHKAGDDVRVYTRNLNDVTAAVPEDRRLPCASVPRAIADPRRRSDRAAPRRPAASVPADDAPLRPQARRRSAARASCRSSVFFFDCLLRRRRVARRPPAARAPRRARRGAAREKLVTPSLVTADVADGRALLRRGARARPRRRHGEGAGRALRGGAARRGLAEGEARPHARSGGARGGMGPRPAQGLALQPAPRRARSGERRLRDARQDVQGHDRRDARVADEGIPRTPHDAPGDATSGPCTCGRSSWSRSRSTTCRKARTIPAALALRFARVKGYRPDKRPEEADTIDTVRAHLRGEPGVKTLGEWLELHRAPASEDDRARPGARRASVFARMNVEIQCPVITVAGTNGKGSTCAMLESILRAARLPHRPLHLAASRCATTSACASRAWRRPMKRCADAFAAVEAAREGDAAHVLRVRHARRAWLFAREKRRGGGARGRARRPARRGECRRCRLRGADQRRHRPRRLSRRRRANRSGARRPASSAHGRPAVIAEPRSAALGAGRARRQSSFSAGIFGYRRRRRSGATGARAASAAGSPIPRCAARCSCATRRRRSARSSAARAAGRDAGHAPRTRRGRRCPGASRCCRAGRR